MELWESFLWWALFSFGPPFLTLFIFFWTTYHQLGSGEANQTSRMILKQPIVLMAPLVTPFTFTVETRNDISSIKLDLDNGKVVETLSNSGSFRLSASYTGINFLITGISASIAIIWKSNLLWGHLQWGLWGFLEYAIMATLLAFTLLGCLLVSLFRYSFSLYGTDTCIKHELKSCPECSEMFSYYKLISR